MLCWGDTDGWDEWSLLEHQLVRQAESPFELAFFNNVVRQLGIAADRVQLQEAFVDSRGRQRRIDFAFHLPGGAKLAVEVDGFNKDPGHVRMSSAAHDDWTRRQNDLVAEGWSPLRFTNHQAKLEATYCRRAIEDELRRLEQRAGTSKTPAPVLPRTADAAQERDRRQELPVLWLSSRGPATWILPAIASVAAVAVLLLVVISVMDNPSNGGTSPVSGSCPADFPVKGNESQSGEVIYHEPGWRYYESTLAERCFSEATAAEDAGFRASEVQ